MSDNDVTTQWNELFKILVQSAQIKNAHSLDVATLNHHLAAVGLIQPFNWNAWGQPVPELHEVWKLDIFDCIRHITRFVRADRFIEGELRSSLRSGALPLICLVAFQRTNGEHAPQLKDVVAN